MISCIEPPALSVRRMTALIRLSNSSGMLFPHKADQVLFICTFQNFYQRYLRHRPNHFDYILLKVVNILTVTQTWVADHDHGIGEFGQFFYLTDNGSFAGNMQNNGECHGRLPFYQMLRSKT